MSVHCWRTCSALVLALMIGCAHESRVTEPSTSEIPFASGILTGAIMGRLGPAQTTTSPGATLTGLVGEFTTLATIGETDHPAATVYFTSAEGPAVQPTLWQVRTDGTGLLPLEPDTAPFLSVSPPGRRQVFWQSRREPDDPISPSTWYLMERFPDGTTRELTSDVDAHSPISWTPDESAVIYPITTSEIPSHYAIRRFVFGSPGPEDLLREVPDSFRILLRLPQLTVGVVSGRASVIYEKYGKGLNLLDLTTGHDTAYIRAVGSDTIHSPDLSPDGRLLFTVTRPQADGILRSRLMVADAAHPEAAQVLPFRKDSRDNYRDVAHWVPDGSGIVVRANGPPYAPPFNAELVLIDPEGTFVRQLTNYPRTVSTSFSVGPSGPPSQVLVGDQGLLASRASGIIFGQHTPGGLSAVVAFQSDRPGTVSLAANTGLNSTGPALTYTLTAERLRTLRFVNDPLNGTVVTVVDSTAPAAGGALINFDAGNGAVTLILPFAEGTGAVATVVESGGTRIYRGSFLAAWKDRANLAPHGATEIRIDIATGRTEVAR